MPAPKSAKNQNDKILDSGIQAEIRAANKERAKKQRLEPPRREEPTTVQALKRAGEKIPDFGDNLSTPPRITMFDEGRQVFLEKEDNSSLTWKVIKGTMNAYRNKK